MPRSITTIFSTNICYPLHGHDLSAFVGEGRNPHIEGIQFDLVQHLAVVSKPGRAVGHHLIGPSGGHIADLIDFGRLYFGPVVLKVVTGDPTGTDKTDLHYFCHD